jgi:F0F1-type ATP synthase assembly protein I
MADEDAALSPESAPEDPAPISLPPRTTFPPPPDVNYTRPTSPGQARVSPDRTEPPKVSRSDGTVKAGAGLAAGVTFAASIIAGFFIGQFIDGHLHTGFPWGTLVFTLLGVAAGFLNLMRLLETTDRKKRP